MQPAKSMKAVLLTGHGGPERLVYHEDWPMPEPGPGEVLVQVGGCGVNNTDIWVREGAYGSGDDPNEVTSFGDSPMKFPLIQGADIAGIIVGVGEKVDPGRVGARVMVDFGVYSGPGDDIPSHDYFGSARDGGFAEYVAIPAENAHVVETSLTDAELATFCCAYVTGERMLNRTRVGPGERVLVTGASGGVGSGVVQLCRARGAVPYALTSTDKLAALVAIGAEAAIPRGEGGLQEAVAAAIGAPVDIVVDTVAGRLLPDLLEILRPAGRYVTCGAIGGPMVEIDMRRIYLKNLEIHGSTQGTRADFRAIVDHAVSGRIKPLLAGTYPLREVARAHADFKRKAFVGKLVVVPGE